MEEQWWYCLIQRGDQGVDMYLSKNEHNRVIGVGTHNNVIGQHINHYIKRTAHCPDDMEKERVISLESLRWSIVNF